MIAPYVRPPEPPRMALLSPWGDVVDEDGRSWPQRLTPPGTAVYAPHRVVRGLLVAGHGEALCWNGQPIRFRAERIVEKGWTRTDGEATVIRTDFPEDPMESLRGLAAWRTWLAGHRAAAGSTMGSAAWSLLRATLTRPLWTTTGEAPPIRFPLGGRQEQAVATGTHLGAFSHYDLPAAYASTLAGLAYGGRWRTVDRSRVEKLWANGSPVYVRARVTVPSMIFGPVPRRPRGRPGPWEAILGAMGVDQPSYPVGLTIRGTWSWPEVAAAIEGGCRVRIEEARSCPTGRRPFLPWWDAIEAGRRMPGFAGRLAKMTGNALVGRLALSAGERTSLSFVDGVRRVRKVVRPEPPEHLRAPDLAETVTGSVRSRLWADLLQHPGLIVAHTDGGWVREGAGDPAGQALLDRGWRVSDQAERLDVLGPQQLAYRRPGGSGMLYKVAGVPREEAPGAFDDLWRREFREG